MAKKKSAKMLKKKRWELMSRYIRLKAADENGIVECVTCGKRALYTDGMQAGHFVPKAKGSAVYFEEENIHVQCVGCNMFKAGNLIEYTRYMIDMYGIEKVDELRELAKTTLKFTTADHEEAIRELKEKLKEMES